MNDVTHSALSKDDYYLIKKLIGENGYKLTAQRKLIIEQFFNSKKHLSVEELYMRLGDTNIGMATLYRNVNIFSSIGILKEIAKDGVNYYEPKIFSKKPLHIHFKCVKCGDLIDINERKVAIEYLKLNKTIEEMDELEIYDLDIMLSGICSKCR